MEEKVSKRVELLIYDKGFSSIRQFAEYLKREHSEYSLSEDTISNFINGKGFQNNTLVSIAKGLDLPVDCLTAEYLPLVDGYLFDEVAYEKELNDKNKRTRKECEINNLETVKRYYDIDKRTYPGEIGDIYHKYEFRISTLAELSIYLPLCDLSVLADILYRIFGQVSGYECYILEKYSWLYKEIPDIPAKKYADYQAIMLRLSRKQHFTQCEKNELEAMKEYQKSKEYEKGYEQYGDIVRRTRELFNNPIINDILKARLPEVYDFDMFE